MFDTSLHQLMAGGDVNDGTPVRIRFIGYRFVGKVVTKAMVTPIEPEPEEDEVEPDTG